MAVWVLAILGQGVVNVVIALSLRSLPIFARIARNTTLSLRERRTSRPPSRPGAARPASSPATSCRTSSSPLLVVATLRIGSAILLAAS